MSNIWLISCFIFLLNQAPLARSQCPAGCRCQPAPIHSVECFVQSSSLPTGIPTDTVILSLTCHSLITPESEMFTSFQHLETLTAVGCFNRLSYGMFNGLPNLLYLDIQNGSIAELMPGIFNHLGINVLSLRNNSIQTMRPETFSGMISLSEIHLNANNLTFVDVRAFHELPNTLTVEFNDNPLICDCNLIPIWERFHQFNANTTCSDVNELGNTTWAELNSTVLNQTCTVTSTPVTTEASSNSSGEASSVSSDESTSNATEGEIITSPTSGEIVTSPTSGEVVTNETGLGFIIVIAIGVIVALFLLTLVFFIYKTLKSVPKEVSKLDSPVVKVIEVYPE